MKHAVRTTFGVLAQPCSGTSSRKTAVPGRSLEAKLLPTSDNLPLVDARAFISSRDAPG